MKGKIYVFLILIFFNLLLLPAFSSFAVLPQDITFIVHGKVYDDSTGAPIPNHEVYIAAGQGYTKTVLTGPDGNYGDTIAGIADPQTFIQVSTKDCENITHSQSVTAANLYAIINFAICADIEPPQTFHIGGLLFAGDFPINNPESTGDTGMALLYRSMPQGMVLWETITFTQYGYFFFLNIPEGDYRIKTFLTPSSLHFNQYIPTWSDSDLQWKQGDLIHLNDSNIYQADVHLVPKQDIFTGIGKIKGFVSEAETGHLTGGEVVPGAEVLLYTSQGIPADYRITDENGAFSFTSLPEGNYKLFIDFPGKYSIYTEVAVTQSVPVVEGVHLELFPTEVNGISNISLSENIGSIFPNPVNEKLRFTTEFTNPHVLSCIITGISGSQLLQTSLAVSPGISSSEIATRSLKRGMYILIIKDEEGKILKTEKFIKE
jgi:hypothetical protein